MSVCSLVPQPASRTRPWIAPGVGEGLECRPGSADVPGRRAGVEVLVPEAGIDLALVTVGVAHGGPGIGRFAGGLGHENPPLSHV